LGLKGGQCISLTTSPPSVSQLARKYGNLNISQLYGPPHPVTGIALLYFTNGLHFFIGKRSGVKRGKWYTLVKCRKVPDVINYSEEFCNNFVILNSMMIFSLRYAIFISMMIFLVQVI
jgi:hypothetical protein